MRKVWGLGLATGLALAAAPAEAGCAPREVVVKALERDYGEYATFVGVQRDGGSLIEVFVSDDGSWTVIESFADGRACSRAFGESWVHLPKAGPDA
ncbi:MAG TPA: hypothetical protein VGB88_00780 [Alphaproteobacteria bacterium]